MPDSTFWLDWIQERIEASGSDPSLLDGLDGCFKIALSNCASVQIAQEWINNILHRHEAGLMVFYFRLSSFREVSTVVHIINEVFSSLSHASLDRIMESYNLFWKI